MKRKNESLNPDRVMEDSGVPGTSFDNSLINTSKSDHVAGKILSLQMINFMCHSNCELNFNNRINFITGRNGSGKSAIMAALTVVLGGSASLSNRGKKISDLIKKGESWAMVRIILSNEGPNAYKRQQYGSRVVISRHVTKAGTNSYACKSESGAVVSKKKEEVDNIVSALNLQIGNPICVLNQDVARSFLCSTDKNLRFKMFMKATQLQELKAIYADTLELLVSTTAELRDKKKGIEEGTRQINELKEKLEVFVALEKRVREQTRLENEYLWALVADEEKKLERLEERRSRLEEKKEEWTRGDADAEKVLQDRKEEVSRCQKGLEERKKAKEEKSGEMSAVQREVWSFKKEIERAEVKLKAAIGKMERQLADINGVEEHLQKNTACQSQAEKEQARDQMNELRRQLSGIREEMQNGQVNLARAEAAENNHLKKLESARADLEELEQNRTRLEAMLAETRAKAQNGCLKYGPFTQELAQAIEEAARKNCFQRKPVGPCGMHVTLTGDPKWARAVESVIGGLMATYCCDNQKDFQVLSRIMERICGNKSPPVIISKFLRSRHNVESEKVSLRGFNSVLDVLSFNSDIVFNTFIDQAQIERILLFESDQQAASILTHIQNVPKNLQMGLTLKSDQYFPAPNYRTYCGDSKRPLRFFEKSSRTEETVKRLEEELRNTRRTAQEKRKEMEREKEDAGRVRSETLLCRNSLKALKQEERRIQVDLNHLSDREETRPVALTNVVLEEELANLRRKHKEASEEVSLCREEVKSLKARQEVCATKLNALAVEESEAEADLGRLSEELEEKRSAYRELLGKRKRANERLAEIEGGLKGVEEEIRKCQRDVERRRREAEEVCPERIETEKSPVDVQKLLENCRRQLKMAEKLAGKRKATIEEFKAKNELLEDIKRKQSLYQTVLATAREEAITKEEKLKHTQSYTASLVSFHFQATLKTRGYDGSLKVDFENKVLELEVKPKDAGVARKDSKTLSGGERSYSTVSFILAIWKVVHMPFYFLDEFDVFMDKLNRKIIMDLLLEHAQFQSDKQFVFITPQDISSIPPSDCITIFKMEDPERGAT